MTEAPRWRLTSAHYLNILSFADGTKVEWEHKETARESGRTVRKLFPVPALLDPRDPADCNYPGEIVVAHEIEGAHNLRADLIFVGEPTQEMEPLNDAAEVITAGLRDKWTHPIETLPANGGMTPAESVFMKNMMETFAKAASPAAPLVVDNGEVTELRERLAKLEAAAKAKPTTERRV